MRLMESIDLLFLSDKYLLLDIYRALAATSGKFT
jgi:hypothetical protein